MYTFQCTELTDMTDIEKFLLFSLVDSHFVLLTGLELLSGLVRRSLVGFLKLIWEWRMNHSDPRATGTEVFNLEGIRTRIRMPLKEWGIFGIFVIGMQS